MNEIEKCILLVLLTCGGKYRYVQSANVIGEVLANYFAIGDEKIYPTILNMAKQKQSPILLQSKDSNKENACELSYRYTEIKISSFGKEVLDKSKKI